MMNTYCAAEVLEQLQAENAELKQEHKKFCDVIEHAGQYLVFFHSYFSVTNSLANSSFS